MYMRSTLMDTFLVGIIFTRNLVLPKFLHRLNFGNTTFLTLFLNCIFFCLKSIGKKIKIKERNILGKISRKFFVFINSCLSNILEDLILQIQPKDTKIWPCGN